MVKFPHPVEPSACNYPISEVLIQFQGQPGPWLQYNHT